MNPSRLLLPSSPRPPRTARRRNIDLIGVPLDLGAGRRGVDMGPSAFRIAGLAGKLTHLGHKVRDGGDLFVPNPEVSRTGARNLKFLPEIVKVCRALHERVRRSMDAGRLPLTLGGDHSLAIGSLAGVAAHHRARGTHFGLLWVDAHGDVNTPETTPSGNIHGMPLAASLGLGARALTRLGGFAPKVAAERTVLIGVRDLDPGEKTILRDSGITVFTMKEVDGLGMSAVVERALSVVTRGTAGFHLSFDLDAIDPSLTPGVGTAVPGGINYREAHLLMEMIADSGQLASFDLVELNPILDNRNVSGEIGVELALSALGKRIL